MIIMTDERKLILFYLDDVITMISKHGDLQGIAMTVFNSMILTEK